jgi:uncharacterized protein (TIGR02996 family)
MSTLDALRQAVLASPDDDLPRLVFADYLEENGDPDRAAFIRAQIELAKTPEYEPFAVLCKTRKREWLTGERWRPHLFPLNPPLASPQWLNSPFRRGFGWAVKLQYLWHDCRHLPAVLDHDPVGELYLTTATLDQWREFATSPWLTRVRSVALTGLSSPNEPLRGLRESPFTTGITSLRLDHTNVASLSLILEELFVSPLGKQLTTLSMRLGYGHADEWLEAFTGGGDVSLNECDLYRMGFGPASARAFVDTGLASQMEVLRLNGNPLLRTGMSILATAADNLRILDLTETMLDAKAVEPLWQSPTFGSLRKLVLNANKLDTDSIKAIARSPHLAGLRSLGLANTHCDNAAVRYLTRGTFWPNLVELDLRSNPISDSGAKHLLTAQPAPDLTSLVLPTRNLTTDMRAELVAKFGEVVSWVD